MYRERTIFFRHSSIVYREEGSNSRALRQMKLWECDTYVRRRQLHVASAEGFSRGEIRCLSRRISLTRVWKLQRLRVDFNGPQVFQGLDTPKAPFAEQNHARTSSSSRWTKDESRSCSPFILVLFHQGREAGEIARNHPRPKSCRTEPNHSHIYKPTGRERCENYRRDAFSLSLFVLTCLVRRARP